MEYLRVIRFPVKNQNRDFWPPNPFLGCSPEFLINIFKASLSPINLRSRNRVIFNSIDLILFWLDCLNTTTLRIVNSILHIFDMFRKHLTLVQRVFCDPIEFKLQLWMHRLSFHRTWTICFNFFVIFFFNSITLLCFLLMADSFGFRIMFLWKACVAVFEVCRNIQKLQRCQKTNFQIFENTTIWVEVDLSLQKVYWKRNVEF